MSRHDDRITFLQMRDHAREAVQLSDGRSRKDLDEDRMFCLAMTHAAVIVGEAAKRVTDGGRARAPEIPWPKVVSTRNRLIHGYDKVDLDLLWNTLRVDIPQLLQAIEGAVARWPASSSRG
jgi:uncharacterized protein with HEPN domain